MGLTPDDLTFAVTLPLVPGGHVLNCCINISDAACTRQPGERACWSSNPPDDAEGCCVESTALGGGSPGTQGCPGVITGPGGDRPRGDLGIPPIDFGDTETLQW